ncbi:MAG TPA: YraN family protein [Candidatus Deferrimicrobium sp.]
MCATTRPLSQSPDDVPRGPGRLSRSSPPGPRPPEERAAAGRDAESLVCDHVEKEGMRVVARNFRGRGGEIDIVAWEGDVLVFVEVRFREEGTHGAPEETVTPAKRRRIVSAARAYLSTISPADWKEARFDVAAVEGSGDAAVIRYYRNAFDAKGKIL